jgi:hypothetical protein
MDKIKILEQLELLIKEGELTKEELLDIYQKFAHTDLRETMSQQSRISNILYYIGGIVVFLGICIFVGTNWERLNQVTKILTTLGFSVAMHVAAVLLGFYKHLKKVADSFYFLSALVAPLGIFVTMDLAGVNVNTAGMHSLIAAILFAVYGSSYFYDRRNIFVVLMIVFGTWLFFSFTTFVMGGRPFSNWDFIKYRWLVAGLSYMLLGYAFVHTEKRRVSPWLYGLGVVAFLTAALCLGGWSPNQSMVWELLFPGVVFGIIFLSVYLKVKSFLVFGTMFLMIYILKITSEYFTSGFGWALSLIFVGFALMGVGYLAFYLNKKYVSADR